MPFPTCTLLDDFNRANNASLGANWTEGVNGKGTNAVISSNACDGNGSASSSIAAYTGTGAISSTYLAVQATISSLTLPFDASTDRLGLAVTRTANTAQGYHYELDAHLGLTDVGITFWNDASGLQMGGTTTATGWGMPAVGDKLGFIAQDTGSTVVLEVWLNDTTTWTLVATNTASGGDYMAGPFYPSLRVKYSDALDDFSAAPVGAAIAWIRA